MKTLRLTCSSLLLLSVKMYFNLTDDEVFSLWDAYDFIFLTYIDLLIISVVFISSNILNSIGYRNIGKKYISVHL